MYSNGRAMRPIPKLPRLLGWNRLSGASVQHWINGWNGFQLVVLPSNYAPDYAPFTLDSDGHLLKIPVLIKVATVLKPLVLQIPKLHSQGFLLLLQVDLSRILEIDEVGQVLANQFTLYMTW